MSANATAEMVPLPTSDGSRPVGLSSPPDSTTALKLDGSDSELSDIEEPEEDIGEITPDRFEGGVPIFTPTMEQFSSFAAYMNKINSFGMRSGIVKVIPPKDWVQSLPTLDNAIKTIKVKDPIAQEIMGTGGTYRQVNIQHQRSYNLPQWRQLCEQSEHQPPAKRGERRANQEISSRMGSRSKGTATTGSGSKRRASGRTSKKPVENEISTKVDLKDRERLPTPVSPPLNVQDDLEVVKIETDREAKPPSKGKGGRQPNAIASVSSRRKNNRREAAGKIDEAAFKDFEYRLIGEEYTKERCEELERAYWKTLTYAPPLYGADMPGSLFDENVQSWNLGKLENLLDILGTKIPGVNTAYLYLGMWKATFAWHLEDVDLYSINFNHFGAPKQWYSISQKDARAFEKAMTTVFPVDAKGCDQFLRHKTFLISPTTLWEKFHIKVNKVVHHPGEFVITFPYGYHSGFNLGYNAAEAVNFAMESWLPLGRVAKKCECDQAQDSVWIDEHDMRKLRGEESEYDLTDDEVEVGDEDEPTDLLTPPGSGGDTKPRSRKRKVAPKHSGATQSEKRIRLRIPFKQPCVLCPNDIASEPLLPTDDGSKAHRICALYIPETDIEPGATELVIGTKSITKARLELKCNYCRSKKGAAFQCSQKKCTRAYHATCAAAGGVFVEEGERPVFGEDGTEYKEHAFEFSCRFHRVKRDKKLDGEQLENDKRIRSYATKLATGVTCQMQYYRGDIFAGIVKENRVLEEMLLVNILPRGNCVEVDYKWLLVPDPADYRIPKPSPNAIPLPRKSKQSLVTSKRQANDLPRKEDPFGPGLTWEEFHTVKLMQNASQVNIDFMKENQMWFYLGKNSTEAKAQFTEDLKNPRHNPKGLFLETLPKPPPASTSRHSYPASYPSSGVNQNALNAARATARPALPLVPSRPEKPYAYKPRGMNDHYRVDPQALRSQQSFLQKSVVPYSFGSDPSYGSEPRWSGSNGQTFNAYPGHGQSNSSSSNTSSLVSTPSVPQARAGSSAQMAPKPMNPFSHPAPNNHNNSARTSSGGRYHSKPNPFAKYPYLQKQHNRSPLDYKSPYSAGEGFMNGYEGDLREHLKKNPEMLYRMQTTSTNASSMGQSPTLPNSNGQTQVHSPILNIHSPVVMSSYASLASQSVNSSSYSEAERQHQPTSAHHGAKTSSPTGWERRESPSLHRAIRQNYGNMYNHDFQPQAQPDPNTRPSQNTNQATYPSLAPQSHYYIANQHAQPGLAISAEPCQSEAMQSQLQASSASGSVALAYPSNQNERNVGSKPLYAHQQYFQNAQYQNQPALTPQPTARDVPDVPPDSLGLVEKMMENLRSCSSRKS